MNTHSIQSLTEYYSSKPSLQWHRNKFASFLNRKLNLIPGPLFAQRQTTRQGNCEIFELDLWLVTNFFHCFLVNLPSLDNFKIWFFRTPQKITLLKLWHVSNGSWVTNQNGRRKSNTEKMVTDAQFTFFFIFQQICYTCRHHQHSAEKKREKALKAE